MAATYFDIETLPKSVVAGFQHTFRVTARNANGSVDTSYVGTAVFTSTDPLASVPANYTFTVGDAGTKLFKVRFATIGSRTLKVSDSTILDATGRVTVQVRPPGWGLDDHSLLPYGDAASGIGAFIKFARTVSTREVEVEVSNLVQDNSPFLVGDALNPSTWAVQRLDTLEFLHVVSVTQTGTYRYTLLCLEEFGTVEVTHRASSSTLLDVAGQLIVNPRQADFLGILDEDNRSIAAQLAKRKKATQDLSNPQLPQESLGFFAGTLQVDANGDYRLESGASLLRKLIIRRLMTKPREFFHLPDTYGLGLRVKEPIPAADLSKLKTAIEKQCQQEREVVSASASVTLDAQGVLTVRVRVVPEKKGDTFEVGFKTTETGLVL